MANPEEWGCDSNEALKLTLRGPLGADPLTFHPDYTYPLFGDAETIYGYKGLVIDLGFAGWDMRGFLKVSWHEKINPLLGIEAEDVAETLKENLPEDIFQDENDFQMHLANPSFIPSGQLIDSYVANSNTYFVYKSSLQAPNTLELVNRMQLFVLLLIEGGSFIDVSDDRWQIYILYQKEPTSEVPTIIGYATAYPYHFHQVTSGTSKSEDTAFYDTVFKCSSPTVPTECRLRLSQFIILPPFQAAGHGGKFYDSILKNARHDPKVQEISVEDPSDAFEDLRDRRDLAFLEGNKVFEGIKAPAPKQWVEQTRKQYKMPARQFRRVLEMSLLRDINPHEETEDYRNWRLQVKQRLYNHNIDALAQLDRAERIDKLQQTFKGVEDDYLRILRINTNGFNGDRMGSDESEEEESDDLEDRPPKRVKIQ